tara:strand:+ start:702 stop:962 length:261 start_codon:yes stop_codon:yes gene_type:complete
MKSEIVIIKMKQEKYQMKRAQLIEYQQELKDKGKEIEALAISFVIDQIQETIGDFTDMMDEVKNYQKYTESCVNLITNKIKSNGTN